MCHGPDDFGISTSSLYHYCYFHFFLSPLCVLSLYFSLTWSPFPGSEGCGAWKSERRQRLWPNQVPDHLFGQGLFFSSDCDHLNLGNKYLRLLGKTRSNDNWSKTEQEQKYLIFINQISNSEWKFNFLSLKRMHPFKIYVSAFQFLNFLVYRWTFGVAHKVGHQKCKQWSFGDLETFTADLNLSCIC